MYDRASHEGAIIRRVNCSAYDGRLRLLSQVSMCRTVRIVAQGRKDTLRTGIMAKMGIALTLISLYWMSAVMAYDPKDEMLKDILLPEGKFEAFYQKAPQSEEENAARPPHLHGSFNKYRNPALVGAPNSAAYGFRFDGKRRFNYD